MSKGIYLASPYPSDSECCATHNVPNYLHIEISPVIESINPFEIPELYI